MRKMSRAYSLSLLIILIIFSCRCNVCLKLDGTLVTKEDWAFLARFCFLSKKGEINFQFEYPYNHRYQKILLYFDGPGQWEAVYKSGKVTQWNETNFGTIFTQTCDDKLAVLRVENNQVIHLYPGNGNDNCKVDGETEMIKCSGGRSFRSSRERWWFLAASRCNGIDDDYVGLNLTYHLHMTNGDPKDILHHEFSADEFYILPIDIGYLLAYIGMVILSITCAMVLKSRQLFHSTYKLYMASLSTWAFGLLLLSISYGRYGSSGHPQDKSKRAGQVFCSVSVLLFLLMLILMAKGFTITRGKLSKMGRMKIFIFMLIYVFVYLALFIYEMENFDPGLVLYLYDSPPGYGLIALRLIGWIWFLYAIFFTLKNYPEKGGFYMPFFIMYSLWFWAGPIMIIVSTFAMKPWRREKTVVGVENTVALLGHLFFLILTRPQAANKNFPYHVRTSQIGAMENAPHELPNGETETPNNNTEMNGLGLPQSYTVRSHEERNGTGPDFTSLFITSQTYSEKRKEEGTTETVELTAPNRDSPPPVYAGGLPPLQGRLPPLGSDQLMMPSAPPLYESLFTSRNNQQ